MRFKNSPLKSITYAFQFDASLYAKFMREFAQARGVKRIEGRITHADQKAETGHIEKVILENGDSYSGDLFIDCSGFRGLLIEQTLKTGYTDWSNVLPCDRAVARASKSLGAPPPYTRATAKDAGWQWRIPLQSRNGNGHVYCSSYISDDEALESLNKDIDGDPISDPNFLRFKTGIRKQPWNKNVVSLGLSAGFLEPLESTSIHLIQTAVARLMANFPDKNFAQSNINYFNARTLAEYQQVRDFLILHYYATEREDTPFWKYCKNMDIPQTLKDSIVKLTYSLEKLQQKSMPAMKNIAVSILSLSFLFCTPAIAQETSQTTEPADEVIALGTVQRDKAMAAFWVQFYEKRIYCFPHMRGSRLSTLHGGSFTTATRKN